MGKEKPRHLAEAQPFTMAEKGYVFSARLSIASIALPLLYMIALPALSTLSVGDVKQASSDASVVTYTMYRACPRQMVALNFGKDVQSISGYISSAAGTGPFATLTAPALAALWLDPLNAHPSSTVTLLLFYTFWTLFLATPCLANPSLHDALVLCFAVCLLAHFALVLARQRKLRVRERRAEALVAIAVAALVLMIVFELTPHMEEYVYYAEVVALSATFGVTPCIRLLT